MTKSKTRKFTALTLLLGLASSASADTYYWDSNGATSGFGTTNGTWGTNAFWSTDDTGASATANTTITTADTVYFGTDTVGYTGGRTVTVSGTKNVGNIIFGAASGAVTLNSGTINLGALAPTITVNNSTNTIASVLTGSNGFTKNGDGLLILTGVNTYSGTTLVSGGTLRFGTSYNTSWNNGRLPATSNLQLDGGIVQAWYYKTMNLGTGAGQIQITGGRSGFTNLQSDATSNFITFGTTGTTVTWGDAAFNPSTFVMNDVGAAAVMRIANPFDLNGAERTIEVSATGAGAGRGTYGILTGDLSGTSASLTKVGDGTLMLSGTNTYDGGTTINGGGVWFDSTAAMPSTGQVTVNDGGVLSVTVGAGTTDWGTGTSGVGTIGGLLAGDGGQTASQIAYNGNVGIGLNINGTRAYAGDIADVGDSLSLHIGNKDGSASSDPFIRAGTLTLSGNNTYTGGTFVNVGTLIAGSATALGNGGDITFNGGTLQYTAASAGNDYGSRIKNSSAAIALNTNGQDVTLSNLGSGNTGGLTKSGAGTLTLSGTNTFGGLLNLSTGILVIDGGTTTPNQLAMTGSSTTLSIINGGTLNATGGNFDIANNTDNTFISIVGGGSTSTLNLGSGRDFNVLGYNPPNPRLNKDMTLDGAGVSGSAVFVARDVYWGKSTSNSDLLLTNGALMNIKDMYIGSPYYSSLGTNNTVTIVGGTADSTMNVSQDFFVGYGERPGSFGNTATVDAGGHLNVTRHLYVGDMNSSQNTADFSTDNKLSVINGGMASMNQLFVGRSTISGRTADANILEVTNGGKLTTGGISYVGYSINAGSQSNDNTATITGSGSQWNASSKDLYVGFTNDVTGISQNNILTVASSGVLTNVSNLIVGSGPGTVDGNKLVLDGGSITASTVTVSTNNTLAGTGTITGAIASSGTIAPGDVSGNQPGTLAVTGGLTLSGSANFSFDIGTSGDLITLTGQLIDGDAGGYLVNFNDAGGTVAGQTYTLITFDSSTDIVPSDFINNSSWLTGDFIVNSSDVRFSVATVVPEPSSGLILAGAALMTLRRRRSKRVCN